MHWERKRRFKSAYRFLSPSGDLPSKERTAAIAGARLGGCIAGREASHVREGLSYQMLMRPPFGAAS